MAGWRTGFECRAAVRGLALVAVLWLTACTADADQGRVDGSERSVSEERSSVAGIDERVVTAARNSFEVPVERLRFDEPVSLAPSDCAIHPVWDIESTSPFTRNFALVNADTVLVGRRSGILADMLGPCFTARGLEPTAQTVATVIVMMEETPGPLEVLSPDQTGLLRSKGLAYEAPSRVVDGAVATTTFLALDREIEVVLRVTAISAAAGTVTIDYDELG